MDDNALFERVHDLLIEVAVAAREMAIEKKTNYRFFYVGCAVLARRDDGLFGVFSGYNFMERKGDPQKCCAEKHAIQEAASCGYTRIIAIVVVGKPQADDESGIAFDTLHPCGACRRLFNSHPAVSPDTLVLTVHHEDTERLELWTVHNLTTTHFLAAHPN